MRDQSFIVAVSWDAIIIPLPQIVKSFLNFDDPESCCRLFRSQKNSDHPDSPCLYLPRVIYVPLFCLLVSLCLHLLSLSATSALSSSESSLQLLSFGKVAMSVPSLCLLLSPVLMPTQFYVSSDAYTLLWSFTSALLVNRKFHIRVSILSRICL